MSDDLKESAILFVLGLLEAGEKRSFLAALAEDAELRVLVAEYRAVFATLSVSGEMEEPPASLRAELLAKVSATSGDPKSDDSDEDQVVVDRPGLFSAPTLVPWLVAAALAVASVVLILKTGEVGRERDAFAELADFRNLDLAELEAQTEALAAVSARVAWSRSGGVGMIQFAEMPPVPSEKSYQLWVFEEGNTAPVSAGVFDPAADSRIVFRPVRPVEKAVAFAVSIEVEGGRPQPEGEVILVGKVAG